jgi:hypothetical protein
MKLGGGANQNRGSLTFAALSETQDHGELSAEPKCLAGRALHCTASGMVGDFPAKGPFGQRRAGKGR